MSTLMHPRVAENYRAMGYYPTDEATMRGIVNLLEPSNESITFLDPCCGCASALAQLSHRRRYPFAKRVGIELDDERAKTAKSKLDDVLHASAHDVRVTAQSVDCMLLNPPYGWALSDKESGAKAERLEHQFLHQFFSALRTGGLIIYIVPKTSMTERYQKWFSTHFDEIRVFEAATDRFNQIVVMGIKRASQGNIDHALLRQFQRCNDGDMPWAKLPVAADYQYRLAGNDKTLRMFTRRLDAAGIETVKNECNNLWQDFDRHFTGSVSTALIRPLHDLTDWHTCLLISSGIVGGIVDNGQRRLLIKGKTTKTKVIKDNENDSGNVISSEHRDRFQTVIKAIDLTPQSKKFGSIIHIR